MGTAIHFIDASNIRAMAGSVALHALMGAWFFSSAVPVEIMPQQMVKVTMIAAPATEIAEQKSKMLPQEKPKPRTAVEPVKPQPLASLSPSVGNNAAAPTSAQLVTTAPRFDAAYLNNPAPEYPSQARRRGMEGSVMLGVVVRPDGTTRSVTVAESSGFAMLDVSAKEAVSRWKFIPAKRGNETVEARVMVPIDFRLE